MNPGASLPRAIRATSFPRKMPLRARRRAPALRERGRHNTTSAAARQARVRGQDLSDISGSRADGRASRGKTNRVSLLGSVDIDRIGRLAPVLVRVIHHQVHEARHQSRHDDRAVAHLPAVQAAAPSGAAVNELVAQHIEAVEQRLSTVAVSRLTSARFTSRQCRAKRPRQFL